MTTESPNPEPEIDPGTEVRSETLLLVERFCNGEEEAFDEIVERWAGRVFGLVQYFMGPELRARYEPEDVSQEVWLEVFTSICRFRPKKSFGSWLGTLAKRKATQLNNKGRKAPRPAGALREEPTEGSPGIVEPKAVTNIPGRRLYQREKVERLVEAIERLPEESRKAVILFRFQRCTLEEIAAQMNRSRDAVRVLISRETAKLRDAYKELGDTSN